MSLFFDLLNPLSLLEPKKLSKKIEKAVKSNDIFPSILSPTLTAKKIIAGDNMKPKIGSVLKVDLVGGIADHTGIYIGDNKIVEVYNDNGTGIVRIVSPKEFRVGDGDTRTGNTIDVAVKSSIFEKSTVLYSEKIAQRAIESVGKTFSYELIGRNCHGFTSYCITGDKRNLEKDYTLTDIFFRLEEVYSVEFPATVLWASTGITGDYF